MKIAYVVPGGVDPSETHRVIPHLLERFRRLGDRHEVHVFSLRHDPTPGRWRFGGAEVHNVGRRPRRLRCLAAIAREHGRAPFHAVHGVFLVPQGVVASVAGRVLGLPVVAEEPGGGFVSLPDIAFGGWRRWQGRAWIRLALRNADRVLVPSAAAAEAASRRGYRTTVVPWGTAREVWPAAPPRPREPGTALRIAWIGSLNRVKDPATMVRTAARLEALGVDFVIEVYGEDTLDGSVQREAELLGERIRFRGLVPQSELRAALLRSDVLLVTSRWEGGPRVVHEAAMCGIPTVGTPVGVLTGLAPHAAAVAPAGDAGSLAGHVAAWARDESSRMRVASAAQVWSCAHDMDRCVSSLDEIYACLADPPRIESSTEEDAVA